MPTDPQPSRLAAASNGFVGSSSSSSNSNGKQGVANGKPGTEDGQQERADDEKRKMADTDDNATGNTEWLVAAIYPATLVLASTFYLLSPSAAAHDSYFSRKGNVVNVVFAKHGWFWTSLAFAAHVAWPRPPAAVAVAQAGLRWALATAWWVLVAQWCWGPSLIDRAFLATGGMCHPPQVEAAAAAMAAAWGGGGLALASSAACKLQGGQWRGGHDLSGHVFLLTHASLFLWSELLPLLRAGRWRGLSSGAMLAVLALWWWMLFMTGLYFHTWIEKVGVGPAG